MRNLCRESNGKILAAVHESHRKVWRMLIILYVYTKSHFWTITESQLPRIFKILSCLLYTYVIIINRNVLCEAFKANLESSLNTSSLTLVHWPLRSPALRILELPIAFENIHNSYIWNQSRHIEHHYCSFNVKIKADLICIWTWRSVGNVTGIVH